MHEIKHAERVERGERRQLDDFVEGKIQRPKVREDGNLGNLNQIPVAEVCVVEEAGVGDAARKREVADVSLRERHGRRAGEEKMSPSFTSVLVVACQQILLPLPSVYPPPPPPLPPPPPPSPPGMLGGGGIFF